MDANVSWIATLSDGSTAVEHTGAYRIQPGERKPWVRLCTFLEENDLHLTSLRVNANGKTVHLPREKFDRFSMIERSIVPTHYSLQYHIELDDVMGERNTTEFIDLAAHYDDKYAVHYIQDVTTGNNSWIVVTDSEALAPTPLWKPNAAV